MKIDKVFYIIDTFIQWNLIIYNSKFKFCFLSFLAHLAKGNVSFCHHLFRHSISLVEFGFITGGVFYICVYVKRIPL